MGQRGREGPPGPRGEQGPPGFGEKGDKGKMYFMPSFLTEHNYGHVDYIIVQVSNPIKTLFRILKA